MLQLQTAFETKRQVTLVLGGARSGKSRYGQRLAGQAGRVTLIATAEARGDEEMLRKIARHRVDRPAGWTTVEEPLALAEAFEEAEGRSDLILVDCLALFAANLLEAYGEDQAALEVACERFYEGLAAVRCGVVLISNEVGSGVVPEYVSGRRFRDLIGEMNQRVADMADEVVLMVAGLPLALKTAPASAVRP